MVEIDARDKSIREINTEIKRLAQIEDEVVVLHPEARHHLGVGLIWPVKLTIAGSAGYFCAGLCDGPQVRVTHNTGWSAGDNLMSGSLVIEKNAGATVGVGMRGGEIVVRGNIGSRSGQVMKAGTILCGGNAGYMAGYMMMGGRVIIMGDAAGHLGEFMISGEIYVGGGIDSLGADAAEAEMTVEDREMIDELVDLYGLPGSRSLRKIVSAGLLHHYSTYEKAEAVRPHGSRQYVPSD